MKLTRYIEIKGKFTPQKSKFIYKDARIICKRKGSIVEVNGNEAIIIADITGIDKVYFEIKSNRVRISNKFKDFINNKFNQEFMKFQFKKGYVPYPFTILENVKKAPPGLITRIRIENGKITFCYEASKELEIFNSDKEFQKKNFRKQFEQLLRKNSPGKGLISSFSGGFDSLLLTEAYKGQCEHILHFHENDQVNVEYYKERWPGKEWTIIDNDEKFSEKDKQKYFQAIDEPNCDAAGFAEYLMVKRLLSRKKFCFLPIINGQGADGLFCSGRMYFQNYVSNTLKHPLKNLKIDEKRKSLLASKLHNYGINTKQRFYQYYLPDYNFSKATKEELEKIFDIYYNSIKNESTNFYAALIIMLRYSLHGIEKIKTASRALNAKYYLPFMSTDIIKYAFSIPSKHKVGYKNGKRILTKSYPEFRKTKFVSAPFMPGQLKKAFLEESLGQEYEAYFTKGWIKHNINDQRCKSRG
jgi:hypothetical protein